MSERFRSTVLVSLLIMMSVALIILVAGYQSDTDRVEALGQQIKCPACQGESIGNSPAPIARDMMSLVAERVEQGWDDEAIVSELLSSYSGAVLLDPPASGLTLLLWIAPFAALTGGAALILWWRRHPGAETQGKDPEPNQRRRLAPVLFLAAALAAIVVIAGFFVQDRAGPNAGVAAAPENLSDVSNETMEAVVAANADHPEVDGMRLALAERYYERGDFSAAFPHYLAVAESPRATGSQAEAALVRLGWMAWEGNREADTALSLFDQALAIDPSSITAMYLKGQILWCAAIDHQGAADLFATLLDDPDLENDSRSLIEADLAALSSGASCT